MRVFLTGGVHWFPDYRERFAEATAQLEGEGHEVVTPLDEGLWDERQYGTDVWYDVARRQIKALGSCEALYLLNNWKRSSMIQVEIRPQAEALELAIREVPSTRSPFPPGCEVRSAGGLLLGTVPV